METEKKIYTETDPANAEEKIINNFLFNMIAKKQLIDQGGGSAIMMVSLQDILEQYNLLKKEWYENKNA
jgi:hypothetical protein